MTITSLLILSSCNSEPEPIKLTPKTTTLRGDLKDYFEVVDKEYTLTDNMFGKMITVELRKTQETPFDKSTTTTYGTSGYDVHRFIGYGIKIFDKEDNIIEQSPATADGTQGPYSRDDVLIFLTIEVGETSIIRWTLDTDDEKILETFSSFEITSATEDVSNTSSNWGTQEKTSAEPKKNDKKASGSSNWDSILNDYEKYVDDYIKVIKKANNGDMDALIDAASMLETAQSLSEKLENAEDDLSSTQLSRYAKITSKIATALY